MMEDVRCSSGHQLDSVDVIFCFCSVIIVNQALREKCCEMCKHNEIAVQILCCYFNSLNFIYRYYGLDNFCLNKLELSFG